MISEEDVNLSCVVKRVKRKKKKERKTLHPGHELLYMFKVWELFLYQNALGF